MVEYNLWAPYNIPLIMSYKSDYVLINMVKQMSHEAREAHTDISQTLCEVYIIIRDVAYIINNSDAYGSNHDQLVLIIISLSMFK